MSKLILHSAKTFPDLEINHRYVSARGCLPLSIRLIGKSENAKTYISSPLNNWSAKKHPLASLIKMVNDGEFEVIRVDNLTESEKKGAARVINNAKGHNQGNRNQSNGGRRSYNIHSNRDGYVDRIRHIYAEFICTSFLISQNL